MLKPVGYTLALYAAFLIFGFFTTAVFGLPHFADRTFAGNARFGLQPVFGMAARDIFAAAGVRPGENADRGIIFFDGGPGGTNGMYVINQEESRAIQEGGRPPADARVPLKTRDAQYSGEVMTTIDDRPRNYPLDFAVRDGKLDLIKPASCQPLTFWSPQLALLGVSPSEVKYCDARSTKGGARSIISFYVVQNWFLTANYTELTCVLIHDEIAAILGSAANGKEHICFGFREDGPIVRHANPISVRHHIFAPAG